MLNSHANRLPSRKMCASWQCKFATCWSGQCLSYVSMFCIGVKLDLNIDRSTSGCIDYCVLSYVQRSCILCAAFPLSLWSPCCTFPVFPRFSVILINFPCGFEPQLLPWFSEKKGQGQGQKSLYPLVGMIHQKYKLGWNLTDFSHWYRDSDLLNYLILLHMNSFVCTIIQ